MGANAANAGYLPTGGGGFDAQAAARAGTGGGLTLFQPEHKSGSISLAPGESFEDIKAGFAKQRANRGEEMSKQRAMAEQVRKDATSAKGFEEAAPPEFQYYGDSMFGLLPKDYVAPVDKGPTTWQDREWDFSGVDKGWEDYEADWQEQIAADPSRNYLYNTVLKGDVLHSIQTPEGQIDPRDPYGFGSDYARYYDKAHGAGALQREANRYARAFAENDPAFAGYEKGYGDIDWNDAAQVEDWFRRANMGGTKTAAMQSAIAQNKRTDLTEAALMTAIGAGVGGMAGIGGLGSAWSGASTVGSGLYGA